MKINRPIGTPGAALSYASGAALAARWGANEVPSVESSVRLIRRPRVETGSPFELPTPGQQCGPNRLVAMSGSFALDRFVVEPAGVPSPGSERSP